MDPNVEIGLIVGIGTTISACAPVLHGWMTNRQRRRERKEDRDERDEVAEKAAEAARLLIVQTDKVAKAAAIAAADTKTQLKQIHTLVNSDMTAARQSELNLARELLLEKQGTLARDQEDRRPTSQEYLTAIDALKTHIVELEQILADRLVRMRAVETEAAAAAAAAKRMS